MRFPIFYIRNGIPIYTQRKNWRNKKFVQFFTCFLRGCNFAKNCRIEMNNEAFWSFTFLVLKPYDGRFFLAIRHAIIKRNVTKKIKKKNFRFSKLSPDSKNFFSADPNTQSSSLILKLQSQLFFFSVQQFVAEISAGEWKNTFFRLIIDISWTGYLTENLPAVLKTQMNCVWASVIVFGKKNFFLPFAFTWKSGKKSTFSGYLENSPVLCEYCG